MSRRLAQRDGWAVVTAVVVMSLMMTFGLAAYSLVDTQTVESKRERNRDSSFNLAEGALQQQGYVLANAWPGAAVSAYQDCRFGGAAPSTPPGSCPQPANLADTAGGGGFSQVDFSRSVSWTTSVRDNPAKSDAYTATVQSADCEGISQAPCRWDANGDGKLWVRGSATVRGRTRSVVALLRRERQTEAFPRATLTAGSFATTNNGNKLIFDATGTQIVVRCLKGVYRVSDSRNTCTYYQDSKGQVSPPDAVLYQPSTPPAMTADQIERFKNVAKTSNPVRYHTICPSSLTGTVVFIDLPSNSSSCTYTSNTTYNSTTNPGLVIMPRGTLTVNSGTFYGILHMVNAQGATGSDPPVIDLGGSARIAGGVSIDGAGRLLVGASGSGGSSDANIRYLPSAFNSLATYGTAGIVQNTWRELPPGE